jgi:sterol carrier protein 2
MGLGGATVVTILGRADNQIAPSAASIEEVVDGRRRLGYNPALEAREVREQDFQAVRSQRAFAQWAAETFEPLKATRGSNL